MRSMIAVNTKDFIKILEDAGWKRVRAKGSHIILKHPTSRLTLSVPHKKGDICLPLVKRLMKEAGIIPTK